MTTLGARSLGRMPDEEADKRSFARPLSFDFTFDPLLLVKHVGPAAYDFALRAIVGHLVAESTGVPNDGWVHYSRRPQWYSNNQRYLHPNQTYTNVLRAVDILDHCGLIENNRARPGQRGTESTIRASRLMLQIMPSHPQFTQNEGLEVIVLRTRQVAHDPGQTNSVP